MGAILQSTIDLGDRRAPLIASGPEAGTGAAAGAPLILLHGGGSRAAHFAPLMRALSPHTRAFAYDQRGFGGHSAPPGLPVDHQGWARDLLAVLDAVGLETAVVLGWSLGCAVAINAAVAHPDRIAGLILLGAPDPARAVNVEMMRARHAERTRLTDEVRLHTIADELRSKLAPGHRAHDAILCRLVADAMATPLEMQARTIEASATRPDLLAAAKAVRCPAVLLTGEHDDICPPAGAEAMASALRAPAPTIVADCGHYLAAEAPARVAALVEDHMHTLQPGLGTTI